MNNESNRWEVFSIREYEKNGETKSQFTKVGAAFTNKNGSINVILDCLPIDGKLQLQVPLSDEERERLGLSSRGGGGGQRQQAPHQQQQRGGGQQQRGGYQQRGQGQGNPRNAGQQQRQGAQQRFGPRGPSSPQQGSFTPSEPYSEPEPDGEAGYVDGGGQGESGWEVNGQWITDARNLPKDHPDFIPFDVAPPVR